MTLVVQNTLDPALYNSLATLTGSQVIANKTLKVVKEPVTIETIAPASTTNFDVATQSIVLYNTATNNFILNVRGNATTTLNSLLGVGESVSITVLVPNATTPYFLTSIQIDGTTQGVSTKYQSGVNFTLGNANSTDIYMLFIVKNTGGTWNVYASQTKYA